MTLTSFALGMVAATVLPWAILLTTIHLLERKRDV
jgi:hypothetical protein